MTDEIEYQPRKIGRPPLRADQKLDQQVKRFRVSQPAWDKLNSASRTTGKNIPSILRDLIDGIEVTSPAINADPLLITELNKLGAELRALHKELHPIGNNANQLAKSSHTDRGFIQYWRELGAEVEHQVQQCRTAMLTVDTLLDQLLKDTAE